MARVSKREEKRSCFVFKGFLFAIMHLNPGKGFELFQWDNFCRIISQCLKFERIKKIATLAKARVKVIICNNHLSNFLLLLQDPCNAD